ncbi:MAG TPA: cytidylate kinase family protein [Gaiellales bacterium]
MTVWTISAEEGAGGARIAADLASAADVPLLDFKTLATRAQGLLGDVPDLEDLEQRVGGRFNAILLSVALMGAASAGAQAELEFRRTLPELGRAVMGEAARSPCVILAPSAVAALGDHPGAVHARLRAPLEWRIAAYQREHIVDRGTAEHAVKRDDHAKHMWVKTLYHGDLDDFRLFSLAVNVSRFSPQRVVEILLAAAGKGPAAP